MISDTKNEVNMWGKPLTLDDPLERRGDLQKCLKWFMVEEGSFAMGVIPFFGAI
jgi:hypothetical protein